MKVVVYIRAADERYLRQAGEDPASWVRKTIRHVIELRRERDRRQAAAGSH
jgi:hypothetical protein